MPEFDELEIRINRVVHECLGIEVDNIHTKFKDLDLDSLDTVELILAWEEQFGIEFTDDESDTITTMAEAYSVIRSKIKN